MTNAYDVLIKVCVDGIDESDVENQLKDVIEMINISFGADIVNIEKVGEYHYHEVV